MDDIIYQYLQWSEHYLAGAKVLDAEVSSSTVNLITAKVKNSDYSIGFEIIEITLNDILVFMWSKR